MRLNKSTGLPVVLFICLSTITCWWFHALWLERTFFAVVLSIFLVSAIGLLPSRSKWLHAVSIAVYLGVFLGGCLALFGTANQSFQPTPTARLN
jgi:hypothetical protein